MSTIVTVVICYSKYSMLDRKMCYTNRFWKLPVGHAGSKFWQALHFVKFLNSTIAMSHFSICKNRVQNSVRILQHAVRSKEQNIQNILKINILTFLLCWYHNKPWNTVHRSCSWIFWEAAGFLYSCNIQVIMHIMGSGG